uniref:Uncharacterized protein n=1 Tax=Picea sitchensis TaxID=3332 RepID=A9NWB7_PICSI|nr:unknown [Picea sitchensis]
MISTHTFKDLIPRIHILFMLRALLSNLSLKEMPTLVRMHLISK